MKPFRLALLGAAGLSLFAAGVVLGQQQQMGPSDYRGFSQSVLARIDLADQIRGVADRDLRLSRVTLMPHGHIPLHSHQGDPTILYVLSGVLTNHQNGTVRTLHPGAVLAEFGPGAHWVENAGPRPLVFLDANIHRRKK